jgi:hypothetical protein
MLSDQVRMSAFQPLPSSPCAFSFIFHFSAVPPPTVLYAFTMLGLLFHTISPQFLLNCTGATGCAVPRRRHTGIAKASHSCTPFFKCPVNSIQPSPSLIPH